MAQMQDIGRIVRHLPVLGQVGLDEKLPYRTSAPTVCRASLLSTKLSGMCVLTLEVDAGQGAPAQVPLRSAFHRRIHPCCAEAPQRDAVKLTMLTPVYEPSKIYLDSTPEIALGSRHN